VFIGHDYESGNLTCAEAEVVLQTEFTYVYRSMV
jgi:hypothetical protein